MDLFVIAKKLQKQIYHQLPDKASFKTCIKETNGAS